MFTYTHTHTHTHTHTNRQIAIFTMKCCPGIHRVMSQFALKPMHYCCSISLHVTTGYTGQGISYQTLLTRLGFYTIALPGERAQTIWKVVGPFYLTLICGSTTGSAITSGQDQAQVAHLEASFQGLTSPSSSPQRT